MKPEQSAQADSVPNRKPWPEIVFIALIVALGLLLRVWNLANESVWYDEYITIGQLSDSGLADSLRAQRQWDWHMVPVYHALQYGWWRVFGPSPTAVRWLSVLFGLAAIPMVYLAGRETFGKWAGGCAALLLAISPFHVFHAQGIRPYALVLFLGLVSVWSYWRMVSGRGRSSWCINFAANGLLMWTHLFGTLLLAPQGLCLLLFHRRPWKPFLLWGTAHALMLIPLILWVKSIEGGAGSPEMLPPPPSAIATTLFRFDPGHLAFLEYIIPKDAAPPDLTSLGKSLMGLREEWGFRSLRMRAEYWLGVTYAVAAGLALIGLSWRAIRANRGRPEEQAPGVSLWEPMVFVVLWAVLPVGLLYALAWMTRLDLFHDRFAIYALPALYVLVGGLFEVLPWRAMRVAGIVALAGLLSIQSAAYSAVPVRHGYLPAARHVKAHAEPGEPVIMHLLYPQILFEYNLGEHDLKLLKSDGYDQLLRMTDEQYAARGRVWVVLLSRPELSGGPPEQEGLAKRLSADLESKGIPFERRLFPGMQNVYTFHCGG